MPATRTCGCGRWLVGSSFLVVPLSTDHAAPAETSQWLAELRPIQAAIETEALKRKSLTGAGIALKSPAFSAKNITFFEITENGIVFVKGGYTGQIVVLIPTLMNDRISWRCNGGSGFATMGCRNVR